MEKTTKHNIAIKPEYIGIVLIISGIVLAALYFGT